MSGRSIPISVEYYITTTSDWTTFQIMEGGWWSNLEVECLKGVNRLNQEIVFNDKTIAISKAPNDTALVEVRARCTLNIIKRYLDSYISYLILKGDLPSTSVRIIVDGKEIHRVDNSSSIWGNPHNPMPFNVLASLHVSASQKRKIMLKTKIEMNPIIIAFQKNFEKTFGKKNPEKKDVEEVFGWLRSHGRNARTFLDIDTYEKLTLKTETHFMQFSNLKKDVSSKSEKTLEEITRRYDELRKTYGKLGLQIPFVRGEKEEKKVAPKK